MVCCSKSAADHNRDFYGELIYIILSILKVPFHTPPFFSLQSISYRHTPERRMQVLKFTKKVFRLIYTAVYLTSIMMNIIVASETANHVLPMVYYGWIFIWTTLWGTNCLWIHKAISIVSRLCTGRKSEDDSKALLG